MSLGCIPKAILLHVFETCLAESIKVLLCLQWKKELVLNEKAFPCLETFAGLHYHCVQLSSGICRSLQDIFMLGTRWKMSFAINNKIPLLTFQIFFSTTVTDLLSTKFNSVQK